MSNSKFKVGDRVQCIDDSGKSWLHEGNYYEVVRVDREYIGVNNGHSEINYTNSRFRLTNKRGSKVSEPKKHLYRLRKDTYELTKGTVVEEDCADGTQDFHVIPVNPGVMSKGVERSHVVDNPTWWEEVRVEYVPVGRPKATQKRKYKSRLTKAQRRAVAKRGWETRRRREFVIYE